MEEQTAIQLSDSERRLMELLWKEGDRPARLLAEEMERSLGWNVNATYTIIKRCIRKGAVERLFSTLVGSGRLSGPELERLRKRLAELEEEDD